MSNPLPQFQTTTQFPPPFLTQAQQQEAVSSVLSPQNPNAISQTRFLQHPPNAQQQHQLAQIAPPAVPHPPLLHVSPPEPAASQLHPSSSPPNALPSVPPGASFVTSSSLDNVSRSVLCSNKEFTIRNLSPSEPSLNSACLQAIAAGTPADRPPPLPSAAPEKTDADGREDSRVTVDSIRVPENLAKEEFAIELPTCSQWFDLNSINPIERAQLPTLFAGIEMGNREEEEKYMMTRNLIVNTYRRCPRDYLSVTECRKFIDGDAALLLRLHSCLEYWGIINFQADPSTFPGRSRRPRDFKLSDVPATSKPKGARGSGGPWKCAACGKICVYTYYIIKPGGTAGISMGVLDKCVWCLRCFGAGRYPAALNEQQFLKVDLPVMGGEGEGTGEWSYEECERLIDGIELYKEDWEAVARHVGTEKTAKQCVAYFIQMPIQEPFLEEDQDEEDDSAEGGDWYEGKRKPAEDWEKAGDDRKAKKATKEFAFVDSGNPLLTQLAFLASVVNPQVAAAAAKTALDKAVEIGINDRLGVDTSKGESQANGLVRSLVKDGDTNLFNNTDKTADNEACPPGYVTDRDMQVVCGTALAAAAVRAKQLAVAEEQEVRRLMPEVIELQLRKIRLKVQQFKAIEGAINNQREELETSFKQLVRDTHQLDEQLQSLPSA